MKKVLYAILIIIVLALVAWVISIGQEGTVQIPGDETGIEENGGLFDFGNGNDETHVGETVFEPTPGLTPDACTDEYAPVCGDDGFTYGNRCYAEVFAGIDVAYEGECQPE